MEKHWINHPIILRGEAVDLLPLEKEHFDELLLAASDKKLWELIPIDCSKPETFRAAYDIALTERERGAQYPFVIYHKATDSIIGSTRFFEIFPNDLKLEIGWTWVIKKYWGTVVNFECKLLLLTYCFEVLKTRRVQIKTDENNLRSRKAIEKIGGQFEGVLRKDKIKENGVSRSAAYYSILDDEWETARQKIINQLAERKAGPR
jgi:RimJ/RimL family protein N-acetyltransferase